MATPPTLVRLRPTAVAILATGLVVSACSGDSSGSAVPTTTDLTAYDTGRYPTDPVDHSDRPAGDDGRRIEGQRMAEFVPPVATIDPRFDDTGGGLRSGVGVGSVVKAVQGAAADVAADHGVLTTYTALGGTRNDDHMVTVSLWRFPDEAAAQEAARGVHDALLGASGDDFAALVPGRASSPVTVAGHDDTRALTRSDDTSQSTTVESLTAHGPLVLYTSARGPQSEPDYALDLSGAILAAAVPRMQQFPYTPVDALDDLPVDVDHVLGRAVGFLESEYVSNSDRAVYGTIGALHTQVHQDATRRLFDDTGVDRVARNNALVFRTRDRAAAERFAAARLDENRADNATWRDLPTPQDVPDTRCLAGDTADGRKVYCVMVFDRYVAEVTGKRPLGDLTGAEHDLDSEATLPQRLAAQYVQFVKADEQMPGG